MAQGMVQTQQQVQTQILSQEMRQGLVLLQRPILELRAELQAQMMANPAIEQIDWDVERPLSMELPIEHASASVSSKELDLSADNPQRMETLTADDADRDCFLGNLENYEHNSENGSYDPDALSRRELMFDRVVKPETLQEHLTKQVPLTDLSKEDQKIVVELLIPRIEDDGWFHGSLADIQMATRKSEAELLALLKVVSQFDPLGCGGRDLRETLLYQMEKLDDSPWEDEVRALIDRHLDDLLKGRKAAICADLKIAPDELPKVLAELPKLARKPGLGFAAKETSESYIEPEVFLTRTASGRWKVRVPERNLPEIRISKSFVKLLEDPNATSETKAYVREKIEAANALRDAIAERQETIRKIAQSIVDVQSEVFEKRSMAAVKPLTMEQVAKETDVHNSTVSRTVRDKYMQTPLGVIELRKFFVAGLKSENGGEAVSNVAVIEQISQIVESEDKSKPLSDQKIADLLKERGITVARRTVAKYRESLRIPGTAERRRVD